VNPAQGIRFQFTEEINVWKEYSSDKTLIRSFRWRQELCERAQIPAARTGPTGSRRHKNDLTASDAEQVEVNFRAKLVTLGEGTHEEMTATLPEMPKDQNGLDQSVGETSGLIRWLSLALYGWKVIQ
jgi:hypothetical protein